MPKEEHISLLKVLLNRTYWPQDLENVRGLEIAIYFKVLKLAIAVAISLPQISFPL